MGRRHGGSFEFRHGMADRGLGGPTLGRLRQSAQTRSDLAWILSWHFVRIGPGGKKLGRVSFAHLYLMSYVDDLDVEGESRDGEAEDV